MGGTLTYLSAARLNRCGGGLLRHEIHFLDEGPTISCPTIFRAGDHDHHVPLELLDTIRDALEGLPGIIPVYDADHAFANTHRQVFSAGPTEQAHARSFNLLDTLL